MAIDLYTWTTPNGRKISIALEEMGLEYNVHPVNIGKGEQHEPEFVAISPNHKIPAIVDPHGPDGKPFPMFESGAILIYLAEKTGQFHPTEPLTRYRMLEWLMWQMGNYGPFLGQAHHFLKFAKEDVPYAKKRYHDEANRLYGVLDRHLESNEYLVGDYSIADIATYPWAARHPWHQVEIEKFTNVKRWYDTIGARPAVQKGMDVPWPQPI